jgi:hypothetical protein
MRRTNRPKFVEKLQISQSFLDKTNNFEQLVKNCTPRFQWREERFQAFVTNPSIYGVTRRGAFRENLGGETNSHFNQD